MPRPKTQLYCVILASPRQYPRLGTRWIATDGTVTDLRIKAARFVTFEEAQDFAREKGITLNTVTRYIDTEEYTDRDPSPW